MKRSSSVEKRVGIIDQIRALIKERGPGSSEQEPQDHAGLLYTLWSMGHYTELCNKLEKHGVVNDFWDVVEHFSPRLNKHFIAPDLGDWPGFPGNLVEERGLLPGDILVIKQDQRTLWEWQHAGMIKDSEWVYSAMYTETVLEQPISYYMRFATRLRALRVLANHENPDLGRSACREACARLGNIYGVSDKWYALNNASSPMYCSLIPWYSWLCAAGLNLDSCCPDYLDIEDADIRRFKLCSLPHSIVLPTNLAESCFGSPDKGFAAKTECVLDLCRPGYEE